MNIKPHKGLDEMIDTVEKSWNKPTPAIIKDLLVKKYGIDPYLISVDEFDNIQFSVQDSNINTILNGDIKLDNYGPHNTLEIDKYILCLDSFIPSFKNNTSMLYFSIESDNFHKFEVTKTDSHGLLCEELHRMYVDKNSDYGDSFTKVRNEIPNAILVRLGDKYNRLKNLMLNNSDVKCDESIKDTLMDLANYCIMEIMEMDAEQEERK